MARNLKGSSSKKQRSGKTFIRKSRPRRRNNFVRPVEMGVERLEPRWVLSSPGSLDTTFDPIDHDGVLVTNLGKPATADVRFNAVTTQADGKIIAAGIVDPLANNAYDFLVARFNTDGSLDTSFGTGGMTSFDFNVSADSSTAQDVAIDSLGRIIVVGDGPNASEFDTWVVARLTSSGVLDTSFGGGTGKVTTNWGSFTGQAHGVAVQSDNKIVVVGEVVTPSFISERDFGIVRYNTDGTLDTSFGTGGKVQTDWFGARDVATDVAIQPDGKIISAGYARNGIQSENFAMLRFDTSGTLDSTFGVGGKVNTDIVPGDSSQDEAQSIVLQSNGNIVLGGLTVDGSDFAMARYLSNGTLDTTFNPVPDPVRPSAPGTLRVNYGGSDLAWSIAAQSDGKYVLAGHTSNTGVHNDNDAFALARINSNGSFDSSFGTGGKVTTPITNYVPTTINYAFGQDMTIGPDGKIVEVGYFGMPDGHERVVVARYETGLVVQSIAGPADINEGQTYTLTLASGDPTTSQWSINWGDSVQTVPGNPSSVTHVYADGNASYTISATVTTSTGTSAVGNTVAVAVHNVAPTLTIAGAASVAEGALYTLGLSSFDPGTDTITSWTINWGNGTQVVSGNPSSVTHTYTDGPNNYVVSATATDEDGTFAAGNTVAVTVNNVAPTLTISGAASVAEGALYSLSLSSFDPGADTISSWSINWGDSTQVVSGNPSSVTHTYADGPNSYTISASATDEDGTYTAGNTVAVSVLNVSPTLTIAGAASVAEGALYTLGLSSSDPGADTISSWTINWGDSTQIVSGNPSSVTHTYVDGPNGYTISATATDEDGTYAAGNTVSVTVTNVAPTLTISGAASVSEGSTYTLNLSSFDPGPDTISSWTINWGDSTQVVSGNPSSVTHTYADGPSGYTISATATDEDGTYSAGNTVSVSVFNVAPALAISGASDANEGSPYTLSLSSFDPGTDTITSWTINWGDSSEVVSGNPASVSHTYADGDASYTISASATDEDGTFAAGNTVSVAVHNVAPTLTISGATDVNEGTPYALSLSSFDPGTDTITSWTVNWGDSTEVVAGNPASVSHTYADGDASYTISATATDEDGTFAANTVSVTVHDVGPTLTISGASDTNEGSPYALNLSSFDPGSDTISQWTINWGDGIEVVGGNPASASHTYADGDASYTISATATNEDGTFAAGSTVYVAVHNVAPALAISGAASVDEGSPYSLSLSSFDPGADTIASWTVNWGDSTEVVSGNPASVTHTYADGSSSYVISASATDEDGTFAAGNTIAVTVNNVAPTLTISGAASVNEGSPYTLSLSSFDPGTDTISSWTINWGDGIQVVSGNPSSVSHTYADGTASYTISASATDEDGTFAAGNTVAVTVNNVAPTLAISGASDVNEGSGYTLNLSSFDPGADTISQWTVNWGDGTQVISGNPASVSHTYADGNASYTISASATDEDGTFAAGNTVSVAVHNVAPTLTISGASSVNEGSSYALNLSSFDPGADTISQWSINWGDDTQVVSGNPSSVSHTYADGTANYTISATATDEDGTYSADNTVAVTVNNVAPTLAISGAASVNEGSSYTLNLSKSDPGVDTISQWTINWGDSTQVVSGSPSSVSHTYADGTVNYTISATATDEDGTYAAGNTVAVTVNNVAPTLAIAGASSVNEGSNYTLNLSKADPGADTISQWTINWGDSTQIVSGNPSSVSHTYADGDANYTISATATDEDGTFTAGNTVAVVVHNVAPTVDTATFSVPENSPNGTVVGTVTAHDPGADTQSFSIIGGTGAAAFAINSATGQITVANGLLLDFDTNPTLTLNVQANDGEGGVGAALVTINVTRLPSISGVVYVDVNHNGLFDANEPGIDGVTIKLLDQNGNPVLDPSGHAVTTVTAHDGLYVFSGLQPGTYQVFEQQPTGVTDGAEQLGTLGGTIVANDRMQLTVAATDAFDYAFAEFGQQLRSGDAAGIGFWQNKNGQALIAQGGTQLASWLTSNFGNVFGNTLVGMSGSQVATFYRDQVFKGLKLGGPAKVDAQYMAVALATFFTDKTLAGVAAVAYGFNVTDTGIGTDIVNVGTKGAAFNVANGSDRTIMQLLLATNSLTDQPNSILGFAAVYDRDGNGTVSSAEASLRTMANDVFSAINESGGI